MSTDVKSPNLAVRTLTNAYDSKREYPHAKVEIKAWVAADLLDYIHELEQKVATVPDASSELVKGDKVKTLWEVALYPKDLEGVVETILSDSDEDRYPIKVRFPGVKYVVGYRREELGKL